MDRNLPAVVITGCNKGIGKAIFESLEKKGSFRVYGICRDHAVVTKSKNAMVYLCDLSDPDALIKTTQDILTSSGGIDIVINNAGTSVFKPIEDIELLEWQTVLGVNLTAPYILTKAFIPGMKTRNFGRIINISSDAQSLSFANASAYCASKAGLKLFADCVRKEAAGHNIHVSTVAPGRVDTFFNHKEPGKRPDALKAEDVASQVIYLLEQPERIEIENLYLNSNLEKDLH